MKTPHDGIRLLAGAACLAMGLGACQRSAKVSDGEQKPTSPPPIEHSAAPAPAAAAVAADGFPTGQDSPEGAACDMARAFINADGDLFRKVCWKRGSRSENEKAYNAFIDDRVSTMEHVKTMPEGAAGGPRAIIRVYRVRSFSKDAPASAGYAMYFLSETQFVDVVASIWNGGDFTARTLVVQDEATHVWYTIPRPDLFPFLSVGLNEESDSTELWAAPIR